MKLRMTEAQFTDTVVQLAMYQGWHVAHFRPARTDKGWRTAMQGHKGFPDLALARRGEVMFAELKSDTGKLSPEQVEWHKHIGNVKVWRPSDLEEIKEALR